MALPLRYKSAAEATDREHSLCGYSNEIVSCRGAVRRPCQAPRPRLSPWKGCSRRTLVEIQVRRGSPTHQVKAIDLTTNA